MISTGFPVKFIGIGTEYSTGERTGVVTKISQRGLFWKTWEGELNLGGMSADAGGSAVPKGESMKGKKHDEGKQQWYAMPLEVLEPLADTFTAGEKKYATFNCLQPFDNASRRFYNGMMRHNTASQIDPLARDEETGCYHLAQVAFNALMRLYHARKEQIIESQNTSIGYCHCGNLIYDGTAICTICRDNNVPWFNDANSSD